MVYPRRCPLCGADYRGMIRGRTPGGPASEFPPATLRAEPGATPSVAPAATPAGRSAAADTPEGYRSMATFLPTDPVVRVM